MLVPDCGGLEMLDGYCCLGDHPLQDAGVFPTGGDQVTVVVQEGNVGHVTAVATVLMARSLETMHEVNNNNNKVMLHARCVEGVL